MKQSGLTYTILKPGIFMEVWIRAIVGGPLQARQPITLVGPGTCKQVFVSMDDVAAYAIAAMGHPKAEDKEIEIGGPASYSWMDVVGAVGKVLGCELPVTWAVPGSPIPFTPAPEFMGQMLAGMEMAEAYLDMTKTARTFAIRPTSLDTFAARFFGSYMN